MAEGQKLSDEEKIEKIREYKEKGNAFYKQGNHKKASQSYYRAILYIKGLSVYCPGLASGLESLMGGASQSATAKPSDLDAATKTLICDCYNNLAACMLKESEPKYARIIEFCNKALEVSPTNVKAVFRKGTAQYACGDFEDAVQTLSKAQSDVNVKKLLDQCRIGMKEQEKNLMERYKGMFVS